MNKTVKIAIGVTVVATLYFIGKYLYKKSRTPDDLTLDITNVDNETKSFDYEVKRNGASLTSGKFSVTQPTFGFVSGKNKMIVTNNKTNVELIGKSVGEKKFYKKVKFDEPNDGVGSKLGAVVKDLLIKVNK